MPEAKDEQPDQKPIGMASRLVEPKDGVRRIYSNNVDAMWTPHDVTLKFSVLAEILNATDSSPRTMIYNQEAMVTLAWTEAKLLLTMLTDIVNRYEELNGEITIGQIP